MPTTTLDSSQQGAGTNGGGGGIKRESKVGGPTTPGGAGGVREGHVRALSMDKSGNGRDGREGGMGAHAADTIRQRVRGVPNYRASLRRASEVCVPFCLSPEVSSACVCWQTPEDTFRDEIARQIFGDIGQIKDGKCPRGAWLVT